MLTQIWSCDIANCGKRSTNLELQEVLIKDHFYHLCPECLKSLDDFIETRLENGTKRYGSGYGLPPGYVVLSGVLWSPSEHSNYNRRKF